VIEIITQEVEMPDLDKLRFQKECKNPYSRSEKWFVIDTKTKTVRYRQIHSCHKKILSK
jgi:hypothetical protein